MNRLTLLIDGNWLLQSRFAVLNKHFHEDLPEREKEYGAYQLEELLARSINIIINRFPAIDNIILISDGGSWRKKIEKPSSLHEVEYKGNREKQRSKQDFDWSYVWPVLSKVCTKAREIGMTVSQALDIEGDDWVCHWCKTLNDEGTSALIWSSDNDLKQCININKDTGAFSAWYNDRNGLVLPESLYDDSDDITFFMKPQPDSMVLEDLKRKSNETEYIVPDSVALKKFIMGDNGDNIRSIITYTIRDRHYGVGEKEAMKCLDELGIRKADEYIKRVDDIADWFLSHPKYKRLGLKRDETVKRIRYNIQMICLDERFFPEDIVKKMNECEYKSFDINYIKSNYMSLVTTASRDEMINDLFEGINSGGGDDDLPF